MLVRSRRRVWLVTGRTYKLQSWDGETLERSHSCFGTEKSRMGASFSLHSEIHHGSICLQRGITKPLQGVGLNQILLSFNTASRYRHRRGLLKSVFQSTSDFPVSGSSHSVFASQSCWNNTLNRTMRGEITPSGSKTL